ncbi:pyruvate, phosphate dikinase [Vagococcus sp. PNs007]|uniref:Pyruvate, phosphate dikinase n=1 Tax=Vagococcus proximus TaxID=2991417 RepID=A0ABT5X126_9ENTE|nr:pyruvate, phosphate dikinase [Vagococcus proximus]MDF0479694.1 pyruvate, phosphate dikinase [Vagococcus proximus]
MTKRIYDFSEGTGEMRKLLGGKGANLAEMSRLGLPVPTGFTITTPTCINYLENNESVSQLWSELDGAIERLEQRTGKHFDDPTNLLLVSVRSGSQFSMPGMMDTILNLGLSDETVEGFAELTGDAHFAYDCYRRLLQMFGEVVYAIPKIKFDNIIARQEEQSKKNVTDFSLTELKTIITKFHKLYEEHGLVFPQTATEQLRIAVTAIFESWNNKRAMTYRELHNIDHNLGTAVNVQSMVFGNSGEESGTGVVFSRNPSDGENELFGEFLINAQGEDVVAGIRTPQPIASLAEEMPNMYHELKKLVEQLETHYHDMQDIEFTIEDNRLYLLQTRNGKRTNQAALRIAVEMAEERLITKEEALLKVTPDMVNSTLHDVFSEESKARATLFSKGLGASPGAASGKICFDSEAAKALHLAGDPVILVRNETSPDDIEGMITSQAIVTNHGGMTSHAAVVARGMGTCCVTGCGNLVIDEEAGTVSVDRVTLEEGDWVSVDGTSGVIYLGVLEKESITTNHHLTTLLEWADTVSDLKVRANAETPQDLQTAMDFGAVGVGLARTEHMFFKKERLQEIRKVVLTEDEAEKQEALEKLLDYQRSDFEKMYHIVREKPMVIRLLDPPLHEFLPSSSKEIEVLAKEIEWDVSKLTNRIHSLEETNPMLGHRGCRLGVTLPELYQVQVKAIILSAMTLRRKGVPVVPEIMIPLVAEKEELSQIKAQLIKVIDDVMGREKCPFPYEIGTMIELPRACLIADDLAKEADFFSFGTNDLTQMTYGFSRDDATKFLSEYLEKGIISHDPFQTIDEHGVGELIKLAVARGRSIKPDMVIGVCGELGGDPTSIKFFQSIGLDYVSCSPFRVPLARLTAAQVGLMANE